MGENGLVASIRRFLGIGKKPLGYARFQDPLGDFEISYPKDWRYDRDIAVVDGKYSVSFESSEATFTINVDTSIPVKFDFRRFAKKELEGPESGIYAKMEKAQFRKMPAYKRGYSFCSGGKDYFGGGLMFFTGKAVFSISWSAPCRKEEEYQAIFDHMVGSIALGEGFLITMARK